MTAIFQKHNINDYSLGEMLQLKRKEKNNSFEQVSKITKIKVDYLQALENGDYDHLPDGVYGKNFLKQYCVFLGLRYRRLLPIYEKERAAVSGDVDLKKIFCHQRAPKRYFFLLPKFFRSIILVVVILSGFFYIGYRIKGIIAPPDLEVFFPPQNYITEKNTIEIYGHLEEDSFLFINDLPVIAQTTGDFREPINLKTGMNTISIKAQKKYSKNTVIVRQVLVD